MTTENFAAYEEDSIEAPQSDDALARLTKLGQELLACEKALAIAEDKVVTAKTAVSEVAEVKIPALMLEMGVISFRLASGQELSLDDVFGAHISEERREAAHAWLEANGQAGIIKNRVIVAFERGQEDKAAALAAELESKGMEYDVERKIAPATLKKTAKELMEKGMLPDDAQMLLGVFKKKVAKLVTPGKRRSKRSDANPFND
jgi:hypothetical protein